MWLTFLSENWIAFTFLHTLSLSKIHFHTKAHFHFFPQRWVTLQPDSDYNPREKCKEKRKLDLEAITKEIIEEISDNRRSNKECN